jgi:hypothetical protein
VATEGNWEHLSEEHWGLGSYTPGYVEPLGLFECRLAGDCGAEEAADVKRLVQAATSLSLFDLIATMCGNSTTTGPSIDWGTGPPLFMKASRVCKDPESVLRDLGLLYYLTLDVSIGDPFNPNSKASIVTDPALPMPEGLPPQCLYAHVSIQGCSKAMNDVARLRLCGLQPLLASSPDFNFTSPSSDNDRLASALRHLCEPAPSQLTLPSPFSLRVEAPTDHTRVMSERTPLIIYADPSEVPESLVNDAQCDVCASIEGQDVWCRQLRQVPPTREHPTTHVADGVYTFGNPIPLPANGDQPSWRCVEEEEGGKVCIDRFASPGLRRCVSFAH